MSENVKNTYKNTKWNTCYILIRNAKYFINAIIQKVKKNQLINNYRAYVTATGLEPTTT